MYRWLLCWRYLRTRYIALASVVSVMLGVATMIIVNAVMDGFTTEMQGRMHGILSDVIVESHSSSGLWNPQSYENRIHDLLGNDLIGMTTVVHVPAMVSFNVRGETITRQINLIGIDTETYASVSDFSRYLLHPENQKKLSFQLHEAGYAPGREGFPESGWKHRRRIAATIKAIQSLEKELDAEQKQNAYLRSQLGQAIDGIATTAETIQTDQPNPDLAFPAPPSDLAGTSEASTSVVNPNSRYVPVVTSENEQARIFDPAVSQRDGLVMGISIGTTRYRDMNGKVSDYYYVQPGDDVTVTFPSAGSSPRAINEKFTIVDFYESQMSDYDSTFAFVPLDKLQKYRGMIDPTSGAKGVNSIQLKLRPGADLNEARDKLRAAFPVEMMVQVSTWRDLQGALLAAVQMETTILNILLFLIIAVAGFGILATFFMIVVEKTKDIGILKSLGASGLELLRFSLDMVSCLVRLAQGGYRRWPAICCVHQSDRGWLGVDHRTRGV